MLASQPVSQPASRSVRQSVSQSVSRLAIQSVSQSVSLPVNQWDFFHSLNQAVSQQSSQYDTSVCLTDNRLSLRPSVVQLVSHIVLDVSELIISIFSLSFLVTDGCTPPLWGMGPTAWRRRLGTTADHGQATYVLTVSTTSSEKCGPTGNGGWRVIQAKNKFSSYEHRKEADVIASVW